MNTLKLDAIAFGDEEAYVRGLEDEVMERHAAHQEMAHEMRTWRVLAGVSWLGLASMPVLAYLWEGGYLAVIFQA